MDKEQFEQIIKAIANSSSKDWFDYLTGISSLIISILALIIGFRINKKLSLKTQHLEKQLDTVYKLVDSLYEQKLVISCRQVGEQSGTFNDYRLFDLITTGDENTHLNKALDINSKLSITWEAYHEMEFIKFSANPYMPKSIQKILDEFRYEGKAFNNQMAYVDDKEKIEKVPLVTIESYFAHFDKNYKRGHFFPTPWYITNKKVYNNLSTYISTLNTLLKTINAWLKEYGADEINIIGGHLPKIKAP